MDGNLKVEFPNWARKERLQVTRFAGGEISSTKSLTARGLAFLNTLREGDIFVSTESSTFVIRITSTDKREGIKKCC